MIARGEQDLMLDWLLDERINAMGGTEIRLYKADVLISPDMPFSDLDDNQPTFTGYNPITASAGWGRILDILTGKRAITKASGAEWNPTDGVNLPQVIYGFWLYNPDTGFTAARRFDTPLPVMAPGDAIMFYPTITFEDSFSF